LNAHNSVYRVRVGDARHRVCIQRIFQAEANLYFGHRSPKRTSQKVRSKRFLKKGILAGHTLFIMHLRFVSQLPLMMHRIHERVHGSTSNEWLANDG
jgi:hypothetical protein